MYHDKRRSLTIQEDVWEWPAILHHGHICLANVIDFWWNAFDVIFYVTLTSNFMIYSLGVRWAGDWLVSTGKDPENETSGVKNSPTLGTLVVMSFHLTQGLYDRSEWVHIPEMHLPVLFHLRRLKFAKTICWENLEISLAEFTSDLS